MTAAATTRTTSQAAVGIGAVTAVSRAVGLVRVLVVAAVLGTTYLGNAFQSANSVSNVLFELLAAGALSAVLVPIFVQLVDAGRQPEAEAVAGGVLGAALLVLGAVSLVGVVGAPQLAHVLTAGVPAEVADEQRALVTHLLRFFVPQVLLYAVGTVATAVLHARRRFAVSAAAPIGNTIVMVSALVALRALVGSQPGFDLTTAERALLVVAGTGGVVGFVAILVVACEASGFRLRPRWPGNDSRVRDALRHSGWGIVLHTGSGLLLGGALIAGAAVEGGVVAYQVAWVFFLAPYAILAQPIHTAILPELVGEADDRKVFAQSMRWALERMTLLVVPAAAGMVALAEPGLRVLAFGETGDDGTALIAAALQTLALGLLPYGAFLLLARAFYALGDSRTPGVAAVGSALVGVAVMAVGAAVADGRARVAILGAGHTVAFVVGALWLGVVLATRVGPGLSPRAAGRGVAIAVGAGVVTWLIGDQLAGDDGSRLQSLVACVAGGAVGAVLVAGGYRVVRVQAALTHRVRRTVTG